VYPFLVMVEFFAYTADARQSFTSDGPLALYCQISEEHMVPINSRKSMRKYAGALWKYALMKYSRMW